MITIRYIANYYDPEHNATGWTGQVRTLKQHVADRALQAGAAVVVKAEQAEEQPAAEQEQD